MRHRELLLRYPSHFLSLSRSCRTATLPQHRRRRPCSKTAGPTMTSHEPMRCSLPGGLGLSRKMPRVKKTQSMLAETTIRWMTMGHELPKEVWMST